jgi:hypothetical protein
MYNVVKCKSNNFEKSRQKRLAAETIFMQEKLKNKEKVIPESIQDKSIKSKKRHQNPLFGLEIE